MLLDDALRPNILEHVVNNEVVLRLVQLLLVPNTDVRIAAASALRYRTRTCIHAAAHVLRAVCADCLQESE